MADLMFPPIVNTYMPAFVRENTSGGGCRIYFALSPFQGERGEYAQITLRKQDTNKNALNSEYPMEIKRMKIKIDNTEETDNKYYVSIEATDLDGGFFESNSFYKVQIRLEEKGVTMGSKEDPTKPTGSWINNNLDKFSEWSTVCLIKSISIPRVYIVGLNSKNPPNEITENFTTWKSTILSISGYLQFVKRENFETKLDLEEEEVLKSFSLSLEKIVENGENILIAKSGTLYSDPYGEPNSFNYTFKNELEYNETYSLKIEYTTRNLYTGEEIFTLKAPAESTQSSAVNIQAAADVENGRNKIYLSSSTGEQLIGRYIISRSSHISNFSLWEDIHSVSLSREDWAQTSEDDSIISFDLGAQSYPIVNQKMVDNQFLQNKKDFLEPTYPSFVGSKSLFEEQKQATEIQGIEYKYLWCDKTPESGVLYKYRVRQLTSEGVTNSVSTQNPIINDFDSIYLLGGDRSLKIKFNGQVSSYKYVVMDSKIDTIGGKFPFIKRNGNVKYRQFPVSGLITFLSDDYGMFTNKTLLLQGNNNRFLYQKYNQEKNISNFNDYVYERLFREEVIDFLQDGEIKLFKSLTEGNILIRLMDINLTPLNGLNGYLYSFSATAYEQAEPTVENFIKFNVQPLQDISLEAYLITNDDKFIQTADSQNLVANITGE